MSFEEELGSMAELLVELEVVTSFFECLGVFWAAAVVLLVVTSTQGREHVFKCLQMFSPLNSNSI